MKRLYTTSEYTRRNLTGHTYPDIAFFKTIQEAERDAQWYVDYWKKEGRKVKKPTVYQVRFERAGK